MLLSIFIGCNPDSRVSPLEQALRQAGENRPELEKVLDHYSKDTKDSLKYKAACFLIENMPGHYSYAESETLDRYYAEIDSVYDLYKNLGHFEIIHVYDSICKKYNLARLKIRPDIHYIKADFLTDNIDRAFDAWQNGEWATHLSFDDFCEYILPYKGDEYQVLDNWRE